jgi:hypothetical protein
MRLAESELLKLALLPVFRPPPAAAIRRLSASRINAPSLASMLNPEHRGTFSATTSVARRRQIEVFK